MTKQELEKAISRRTGALVKLNEYIQELAAQPIDPNTPKEEIIEDFHYFSSLIERRNKRTAIIETLKSQLLTITAPKCDCLNGWIRHMGSDYPCSQC